MRRRKFVKGFGGLVTASTAYPPLLQAQQKAMPVIGFLNGGVPHLSGRIVTAFREGLGETGYREGQNLTIEYAWAEGRYDRLPALAAGLVGHAVDVIAASGSPAAIRAAKEATSTIPIVFIGGDDPVADGLVASLARPGGNLTGVSSYLSTSRRPMESGVRRGEAVGIFFRHGLEAVASILGVLKAGCAYVPLNPVYPRERLAFIAYLG